MKFNNVVYMVPQIGKSFLLNESFYTMESATLEGGTIYIDRTTDKLLKCMVRNCKILLSVPTTVDFCHVVTDESLQQAERIDKKTPHAIIKDCYFERCVLPMADYGNNYVDYGTHRFAQENRSSIASEAEE